MIKYQKENHLSPVEFKEVLIKSTLGERRPVENFETIKAMVQNSNLIITARDGGKLVGVARSVTDFAFCTYLSDLAVDSNYQRQGIGKELLRLTKMETPAATTILLSAPKAIQYYMHIGMTKHPACFVLDDLADLKG